MRMETHQTGWNYTTLDLAQSRFWWVLNCGIKRYIWLVNIHDTYATRHGSSRVWYVVHKLEQMLNVIMFCESMQGYQLTDEEDGSEAWTFPAVSIDAGEYLLVYLDGKDIAGNRLC